MSRGVGSRGTWYTFICNLSKCQTEIPDNCNVVIIVGVDYYSPEKHSNPLVIYKDPPKTMALNESTQADGRSSLMGQQLDDNEIQEILKSGTGTNELTPLPIKLPSITIRFLSFRRKDLRHYSQQIERDLKAVENQSIEEYIRESENIASLHTQIGDCDSILERMESMLTNFQVIYSGTMFSTRCYVGS